MGLVSNQKFAYRIKSVDMATPSLTVVTAALSHANSSRSRGRSRGRCSALTAKAFAIQLRSVLPAATKMNHSGGRLATDDDELRTKRANNNNNHNNFGFVISISICLLNGRRENASVSRAGDKEIKMEGEESLTCASTVCCCCKNKHLYACASANGHNYNCLHCALS